MQRVRRIAGTAFVAAIALPGPLAHAGVWRWGCIGPMGDDHIAFNRDVLVVAAGKKPVRDLKTVVMLDEIDGGAATKATYLSDNGDGLVSPQVFKSQGTPEVKVTLTEQSSKRTARTKKLIDGCRDEVTERFTKTYRVEIGTEAARTVTLSCMEYQLSTTGGRKCR